MVRDRFLGRSGLQCFDFSMNDWLVRVMLLARSWRTRQAAAKPRNTSDRNVRPSHTPVTPPHIIHHLQGNRRNARARVLSVCESQVDNEKNCSHLCPHPLPCVAQIDLINLTKLPTTCLGGLEAYFHRRVLSFSWFPVFTFFVFVCFIILRLFLSSAWVRICFLSPHHAHAPSP